MELTGRVLATEASASRRNADAAIQPQAGDFGETGSFRCSEQVPQPVISFADLKIEPVELCITLVLKLSHRWWWIWFSRRRCRLSVAMGGSPW